MPNILEICNAPNEIHIHGASQFTNYLHYFGTMTPKVHFVDVYVQYDQFFFLTWGNILLYIVPTWCHNLGHFILKDFLFLQSNMLMEIIYIGYKQIQQNMSLNLIFEIKMEYISFSFGEIAKKWLF